MPIRAELSLQGRKGKERKGKEREGKEWCFDSFEKEHSFDFLLSSLSLS
jgi:hypothetical protein